MQCIVLLACCHFALATQATGHDWPGWRGDGSGVSAETGLPVEWGVDKSIRWKTRIEGRGLSSPIIRKDRVFVTSAVEDVEYLVPDWIVKTVACLLLLCIAVSAIHCALDWHQHGRGSAMPSPVGPRRIVRIDRIVILTATLLFVIGAGLGWLAREAVITPVQIWLTSRLLVMLAVLAIAGFVEAHSNVRAFAAGVLLLGAVFLQTYSPIGVFDRRMAASERMTASIPFALAAGYLLVVFFRVRGVVPILRAAPLTRARVLGPIAVAATGLLMLAEILYFQPENTVWRMVTCLHRDTGRILWSRRGFHAPAEKKYWSNSYATPTPVTDGRYVVAGFGPGMVCMDWTGRIQWRRQEPEFHRFSRYGAAASPLCYRGKVIHAFIVEWPGETEDAGTRAYARHSYIEARDIATGELSWRVVPPAAHDSYDSPIQARSGDRDALLFGTWGCVTAYDLEDGKELWRCGVPIQQWIPSIVVDQDNVYLMGGTEGLKAALAVRLGGNGDVSETHVVWSQTKGIPQCSSPVLYEGLLYWITEGGVAWCVDARTGERVWRKRLRGHYVGSLVAGDGKVYFPADDGTVTVVLAGRDFVRLAINSIGEGSESSPAISNKHIFLRGGEYLYCIQPGTG